MALVLKLRPQERLVVNGALIRNASEHGITLHLINRATLLHERDILLPEDAKTPLAQLYLHIQALLLDAGAADQNRKTFVHAAAKVYAKAMAAKDDKTCGVVADLIRLVATDDLYRAMRLLKPLTGAPVKKAAKTAAK